MRTSWVVGALAGLLWAGGALAQDRAADMRGVSVLLGGGVEGYTGGLAPALDPGLAYGVTLGFKPTSILGLELGYSGAVNAVDADRVGEVVGDPDVVRNGGQVVATVGLAATPVQPYVLGGVGLSNYNVRGPGGLIGFQDDTVGNVPVGLGLRAHVGRFTADLRGDYNFLFDQDLAALGPGGEDPDFVGGGGRYNAMLRLGATF